MLPVSLILCLAHYTLLAVMTIRLDPATGVFLDEAVVIRLDITFISVRWHPFI